MISLRHTSLVLVLLAGCTAPAADTPPSNQATAPVTAPDLTGTWRAVLTSPGGELPFVLTIDRDPAGALRAAATTGEEAVPFSGVEQQGTSVVLHFTWYDSEIEAETQDDGSTLLGRWRRTSPGGTDTVMPFAAQRVTGDAPVPARFQPLAAVGIPASGPNALYDVHGVWSVVFTDEDGSEPARGEFDQEGTRVTGTFLTPTGDYRFLEGSFEDGVLRLSTFDGAHAFLFQATAQEDNALKGDFWSRDSYHATWTAQRLGVEQAILPDPWQLAKVTSPDRRFRFDFEDLDGQRVTQDDPRFAGKVVLINIFGSWCPNCNDEAPLLAEWHRRYQDQGFDIVGLAYEFTGDVARDRRIVRRFGERYGIDYPLLVAGVSDKADAAATLPDLDQVVSYPTTIFIGRDGTVRDVHSGFSGPGTGHHYETLVAELEGKIEALLAEAR